MSAAATISITDRIATITMDDGKANAFGFDMMAAIKDQRNAQNMTMAAAIISALAAIAAWFATQFFTTL